MHTIWKGGISFGLIFIPVRMYSATKDNQLEFHYVDSKTLDPIGYQKINKRTGKEVPSERIVKAYEYKKGKLVVMSDEDFEAAEIDRSKSLDIISFIDLAEVDPKYFEKPYYLEPEDKAEKTYALLVRALTEEKMAGLAKYVIHTREHLGIIRAEGDALLLQQMRFADEILDQAELEINIPTKVTLDKQELKLARTIVKQMSKPFDPEKTKDTYIDELKKVIRYKAANKEIKSKGNTKTPTKVTDLMAQLQKSLEAVKA